MAQAPTLDTLIEPSARNLATFFTGIARRGMCWDDAWAGDLGLADPIVNSTTLIQPMTNATTRDLTDRLDGFYREADGGPWMLWSVWPTPDLAPLGYSPAGHPPLMARPAGTPPAPRPEGLQIVEATDEAELAVFERGLIEWMPLDHIHDFLPGDVISPRILEGPLRCWVGYAYDVPVTVAMACAGDGVVGVYCVATAPDARGKGYGAAITDVAARCDESLPAVLQASSMGRPVYERIGFTSIGTCSLWIRQRRPA